MGRSAAVAIEYSSVFFEGVHHVKGCNGARFAMFSVAETVTHNAIEKIVNIVSNMRVDLE
jgi:hypothetical protein